MDLCLLIVEVGVTIECPIHVSLDYREPFIHSIEEVLIQIGFTELRFIV
jgi:hypothetical protein